MKSYQDILTEYKKRQHDTVIDILAAGLTYVDEVAVESGILEEAGLIAELTDTVTGALPFAIIAAAEGTKVILGRKPATNGLRDGSYRMLKTGASLGIGSIVAASAGAWIALPTTMCVRALFDRYKSKTLTGMRVKDRINRLHALNQQLREHQSDDSTAYGTPVIRMQRTANQGMLE